MAGKLKNLGAALKDTKTRTLLIVVVIIVLIGLGIGYIGLRRAEQRATPAAVSVQPPPVIVSTPTVGTPSREYIRMQEQENLLRAQQAAREGRSAISTITRTTYVGPSEFQAPGIPTAITPTTPECSPEALARARQAGVKAEELRCKGCNAAQLRAAGYTAGELLNANFSANDLKNAGFSVGDLRAAGFTAPEVVQAGITEPDLVAAGFNVAELSGKPPADCSPEALIKARSQGVSAAELRKLGCGVAALKAAGFSAKELKDAGFTAGELRQAGFTAADLKAAGFSAAELRDAGYSAEELANAGFTRDQLKAAGFSDGELLRAGLSPPAVPSAPTPVTIIKEVPAPPITPAAAPITSISTQPTADAGLAALERLQQRQADQLSLQEKQDRITQLQQGMGQQVGDLFAVWSPPPKQKYEAAEPKEGAGNGVGGAVGTTNAQGQVVSQQGTGQSQAPIIKAGTIMFAVLDTALNSDEPSPILATIVSGPYKGSKLVGNLRRVDKKVIVSFTAMNVPAYQQSIGVNAVAIDPNTARTALANNVDNHYLLRFGSLFAAAFVSGYAKATEQSGSTTNITVNGISETRPNLDAGDKAIVGLGQVGNQFSSTLSSIYTRPPTVTVNAGEGIGILFMADVSNTAVPITPAQNYASPIGPTIPPSSTPIAAGSSPPVPVPAALPAEANAMITQSPRPSSVGTTQLFQQQARTP